MNTPNVPNPFNCARRVVGVAVTLKPSDITEVWHSLTTKEAERLLDLHGAAVAARMLAAGIDAALEIIKQDGAAS